MPFSAMSAAGSRLKQSQVCTQHGTSSRRMAARTRRQPFRNVVWKQTQVSAVSTDSSAADEKLREQLKSVSGVVTDDVVPEGHKGLHGFLYGEQGAEQHDASGRRYDFRKGEDDGSSILPIKEYLSSRENERPLGVYALYDAGHNIQYVGYSRNMVLSIKGHLSRVGEERCAFVRSMVFMNKAMASKSALEQQVDNWINECGTLPPGNGVERNQWQGRLDTTIMTAAELAEYEEKKLKMRKAMGENLSDRVVGESEDARERRLKLINAVEGDDWSAVIDSQTQQTVVQPATAPSTPSTPSTAASGQESKATASTTETAPAQQVVSPFAQASVHRAIGDDNAQDVHMTVANVDTALNEVRPYLQADGGDVEVVGVQDGTVFLRLQGACGTCPSSSATMRMGIERSLRARFGDKLVDVVQVDKQELGATVEAVDGHLNILRGAIENFGGKVEVESVADGMCVLKYKGPKPIQMGVQAAIKDRFPDVRQVQFVDFE